VNLLRAELSRYFLRRFLVWMVLLIGAILGVIVVGFAANTHRITDADIAAARAQANTMVQMERDSLMTDYTQCLSAQAAGDTTRYPPGSCEGIQAKADSIMTMPAEAFLPSQFRFRENIVRTLYVAAAILGLFGFVVGASFIGVEWTSGGVANLLLRRPRRTAVYGAKLAAALLGTTAVGTAYLAGWIGALWTVASVAGDTSGVSDGFWRSIVLTAVRALALALGGTAVGFALASLGRRTASALGFALAYGLIAEIGTFIVFGILQVAFPERLRLSTYVYAWMNKSLTLQDFGVCRFVVQQCDARLYVVDLRQSALVLGAAVALTLGLSMYAFARRDVG
jgi:ABC-2 type transport system permease protein